MEQAECRLKCVTRSHESAAGIRAAPMQEASGSPYRGICLSDGAGRQRGYIPLLYGVCFCPCGLFGLPHIHTKSGRKAIRVIGVVVVDRAVGVHIHEIVGVGGIRGTEPPINGDTGYNLITQSDAAYRFLSLCLILEI